MNTTNTLEDPDNSDSDVEGNTAGLIRGGLI